MKFHVVALLVLITSVTQAQSSSSQVTVSWTAPTLNTDGSTITGTVSYNLYEGTSTSGPWTKVQGQLSAVAEELSTIATGSCFAVTAVVGGVESALSTAVCIKQPDAPTGLTTSVILILSSQAPAQ
jgi:hypothetical protein